MGEVPGDHLLDLDDHDADDAGNSNKRVGESPFAAPPKTKRDVSLTLLVLLHLLQANVMVHVCTTRENPSSNGHHCVCGSPFPMGFSMLFLEKKVNHQPSKLQPLQLPKKTVMKP